MIEATLSILLSSLGFLLNAACLTYYLSCERDRLSSKLFISLIVTDMTICTVYPVGALLYLHYYTQHPITWMVVSHDVTGRDIIYLIISTMTVLFIGYSGYITATISILRSVSIKAPLYRVQPVAVWSTLGALFITNLAVYITLNQEPRSFTMSLISFLTFLVLSVIMLISGMIA